ncbi:MAG: S9 family peptidase, partial [Proteobacteria bacterium]|nr:S9 family peptidase [Pseudomonadota bacterium]
MRKIRTLCVAGALAMTAGAAWAAVPGPARPITDPKSVVSEQRAAPPPAPIADLFNNRAALDAAWSADGKWVVVSAN